MAVPNSFLERVSDAAPALRIKFGYTDAMEKPKTVKVKHHLGSNPDAEGRAYLETLHRHPALRELCSFYDKHDGCELCRTQDSRYGEERPLLEFRPAASILPFSRRYQPGGDLDWTMDLNKSKTLYRGPQSWIAFAEIDSGPSCLTIFLDGDNAGNVYYVTPQPEFNILRPVAKGFYPLLERIAKDPAAFLRLVRATISLRGKDGDNYGYVAVEYVPDVNPPQGTD
jgi:hypothetical protein